jgi:hypothetical protein
MGQSFKESRNNHRRHNNFKIENQWLEIKKDNVILTITWGRFFDIIWEIEAQIELNQMMINRLEKFIASEMATEEKCQSYIE